MKWLISFGVNGGAAVVEGSIDLIGNLVADAVEYGAGIVVTQREIHDFYCESYGLPYDTDVDTDELMDFAFDASFEPVDFDSRTGEYTFVDAMDLDWRPVPPNTQLGLVSPAGPKMMRYRRVVG